MPLVVYISHPVGEINGDAMSVRHDNIANAGDWIRLLAECTSWTLCCPWYPLVVALDDHKWDTRRMRDALDVLERCDMLVLCGGIVSPHMRIEFQRARRLGMPIIDLTPYGVIPPLPTEDAALQITEIAARAIDVRQRRVWMPLMTEADFETLKRARHALYTHLPDSYDNEVILLDRIIGAVAATRPKA